MLARLRLRRDGAGSLVLAIDSRAVGSQGLLAVGGRRALADWAARRIRRPGLSSQEVAWWQEVAGALVAPAPGEAGLVRGGRRRDPPVGLGGVVGAEDRGPRRRRGAPRRRRPRRPCPRRSPVDLDHRARQQLGEPRDLGDRSMNGWPPARLTVMRRRGGPPSRSRTDSGGVPRLIAMPAEQPASGSRSGSVGVQVGLLVHDDAIGPGACEIGDLRRELLDHEVDVERPPGSPSAIRAHDRTERDVRDEVPVHHPRGSLGARDLDLGDLLGCRAKSAERIDGATRRPAYTLPRSRTPARASRRHRLAVLAPRSTAPPASRRRTAGSAGPRRPPCGPWSGTRRFRTCRNELVAARRSRQR